MRKQELIFVSAEMLISFIAESEITCAGGGAPGFPSAVPGCPCPCLPAGASLLAAALSPDAPLFECLPAGASAEAGLPPDPSAAPRPWAGASPEA